MSSPPVFCDDDIGPSAKAQVCDTPSEFFDLMFTDELVDVIVEHAKLYATQKGFQLDFTREGYKSSKGCCQLTLYQ